jgi:hypothetical protein
VLRGAARRRLDRALTTAMRETGEVLGDDPETTRHVLKAAALAVAHSDYPPSNRTGVAIEYAALPTLAVPRLWIATTAAAMFAAAALTALVVALIAWRPHTPVTIYPRPLPTATVDALRTGGQPVADPVIADLLGRDLAQLVVEIDADRRSGEHSTQRLAHGEQLAASPAIAAHGPRLTAAWQAMLAAFDRWVDLPSTGDEYALTSEELINLVHAVSDELVAAGIGYYVEATVLAGAGGGGHALVYCYRIEEVGFVEAGGKPRRVLSLRRLDDLNASRTLLGMESTQLGGAVLLLDQIEEHVASKTLRALAPDAPYPLGDAVWAALPENKPIAMTAGQAARRELVRWLGEDDAETGGQIARLLDERARLIETWRTKLARDNTVLHPVDSLLLPGYLLPKLDGMVATVQRQRAQAIDDEILRLGALRIAARLQQLVAATVRHHEAQHAADEDRASRPPYPAQLEAYLGPLVRRNGERRQLAMHVRAELAAYVSQIANDPVTPQLVYWDLIGFAFDRNAWGRPESYAAVVASEALARALKLPSQPLIHDGSIDRTRLAEVGTAIAALSDDELCAAAETAWRELFHEPLTRIVDLPDRP